MEPFHRHLLPYITIQVKKSPSTSRVSQATHVEPFPFSFLTPLTFEIIYHSHPDWTFFDLTASSDDSRHLFQLVPIEL